MTKNLNIPWKQSAAIWYLKTTNNKIIIYNSITSTISIPDKKREPLKFKCENLNFATQLVNMYILARGIKIKQ